MEGDTKQKSDDPSGMKFDYAKLWVVERDSFEEVDDTAQGEDDGDSWAALLAKAKLEAAEAAAKEVTGRGAKRMAAARADVQVRLFHSY
jgi:hypothetical protein